MLRVSTRPRDVRRAYGLASPLYGFLEDFFEKGPRGRSLEMLSLQAGETALEIGTGTGLAQLTMAAAVGPSGRVMGLDLTRQMLQRTRRRLRKASLFEEVVLCQGDARELPYRDSVFDAVYTASTLEQFDTPEIPRVLAEVGRVLKPGGRLGIVSLSREGRERSAFVRCYEWLCRRFPRYATCRPIYLRDLLTQSGFSVRASEEKLIMGLAAMIIIIAGKEG